MPNVIEFFEVVVRALSQSEDAGWYFQIGSADPQGPFPTYSLAAQKAIGA